MALCERCVSNCQENDRKGQMKEINYRYVMEAIAETSYTGYMGHVNRAAPKQATASSIAASGIGIDG